MQDVAGSSRALLRELAREYLRFSRLNTRAWQRVVSGSVSMSLWLIAAIIAMSWYGVARARIDRYMFWTFLTYFLYSEPVWAAAEARPSLRGGLAEQILAARGGLASVLLPWLFVDSSIWSTVDSAMLLAIFSLIFGGTPKLEQPLLFAAAIPPLMAFSLAVGVAALYLMNMTENTWVVGLAFQLVVPLMGGIIPPTALPKEIARILLLSPLQYVIAPTIYAGTGSWPLDPAIVLTIDYILSISSIILIFKIDKVIRYYLYLFSR
ncbi:ABC-2 type transport system, membrane protein [Thermoproteus uzoniensis 768-20]|uniref:ABC-2 type transport system, membrane protein n=1 Tax=Thermoproteus uzoniensis (strain 768-20) TaxID=999630 RepID=F2L2V8_THEU7|nr:hypothetical protein [Thermoproteus uzoniensis]AEA11896.1 ABC-2 type transport system, membrane protein [Thermoproteus uzoniensis 768-20]